MHKILQISFIFVLLVSVELFPQWTGVTSPVSEKLVKVQFLDDSNGWIAGESSVLRTTDGGTTWTSSNTNISDTRGMYAVSTTTAWICGTFGKISKTTDGGASWVAQTTGAPNLTSIETIFFKDANNGWAAGTDGFLITTSNGGTTWQKVTTTVTSTLRSIKFFDNNNGWAGGGSAFLKTTDGGATWTQVTAFASLRDIHFLDANTGFVSDTWGQDNLVLKTTNGGTTWQATTTISTGPYYFHGIYFHDANTGYAVGRTMFFLGNYGIYKTTDGGNSWTAQTTNPVPMFENFRSVTFTPNGTGWAVGDNGAIYKLTGTTSVNEYHNIPVEFALHQNFPNPFNPSTTFSFNLQSDGQTELMIYNIQGEMVATIISEFLAAGQYKKSFDFNSMGLSSGVYLFKLNHTGNDGKKSTLTRKLTLLK
jgi:photosystem II stability/assembly factor-like uncharacterized protein